MCGIVGLVDPRRDGLEQTLEQMKAALVHRGPDDHGSWLDPKKGVALGHRRLSILDLSEAGRQPMVSPSKRYVVVFNGEVYNFDEIRGALEKEQGTISWRGTSDSEVVLAAIDRWGFDATLPKMNGMFALAVWDRDQGIMHLARDRLGQKPLFYGWLGHTFVFASELGALRAMPGFSGELDREAAAQFLRFAYVPQPWSIFKGIKKLAAGCRTQVVVSRRGHMPRPVPYWDPTQVVRDRVAQRTRSPDPQSVVSDLDGLLADAVRLRMVSDVPVGAFLSGGIDSSLIVSLMQKQATGPVRTFTIGFEDPVYNEADNARAIARHLGTEHTEMMVTTDAVRDVVPRLAHIFDEPFADPSAMPTALVCALAREHVTVVLSGDGGDELFHGYKRYARTNRLWGATNRIPSPLRRLGGRLARHSANLPGLRSSDWFRTGWLVGSALNTKDREDLYESVAAYWDPVPMPGTPSKMHAWHDPSLSMSEHMMLVDALTYLPEDILVKVDRASMTVGLEARAPLLDHRVFESVWSLPMSIRRHQDTDKWLLRQVLQQYVPTNLFEGPKRGFAVPLAQWLRGPLRDWAADLLTPRNLGDLLDPGPIQTCWQAHLQGRGNWANELWAVLMLQMWRQSMRGGYERAMVTSKGTS